MFKLMPCALAFGALIAFAGSVSTASAAGPGFCHDYAKAAVNQVRDARSHYRCDWRVDTNPARWSTDWHDHYNWCLGVSRDKADSERDARRAALDHCTRR